MSKEYCNKRTWIPKPILNNNWTLCLKELEHRKLGWKVLILKYDLGKSLTNEMWCKMADTKNKFTTYFKR